MIDADEVYEMSEEDLKKELIRTQIIKEQSKQKLFRTLTVGTIIIIVMILVYLTAALIARTVLALII